MILLYDPIKTNNVFVFQFDYSYDRPIIHTIIIYTS